MAIDAKTLAASKKYTDETVIGGGAIKGKNCTIDSIDPITGGNRITFKWTLDDGTVQTGVMDVMDGADGAQGIQGPAGPAGADGADGQDGLGIKSVDINENNHLIITYDDDTTHDAGEIPSGGGTGEVTSVNGKKGVVILYATDIPMSDAVGAQTIALTINQLQGSLLNKVDKETGKGLSTNDFSDIDKAKLDALADIKSIGAGLSLNPTTGELEATGISIEIDDHLDKTSSHAIQNQAVAIPIEALQGSVLGIKSDLDNKVDKVPGKGLSENDYTNADKAVVTQVPLDISALQGSLLTIRTALAGKADAADIPTKTSDLANDSDFVSDASYVHTDNNYDTTAKAAVDGLGTAASKDVPASGDASNSEVVLGSDSRLTDARNAADVSAWAKAPNKPNYTASEVGAVATTDVGSANGVAGLGSDGKVPAAQLPSYVDDVLEYASQSAFPATGETGKIYVDLSTNKTYRWSGSAYVVIGGDLALGETSTTAYAGNKGKANADAIAAIKDGTNIDSFSDVETALGNKQDTISDLSTIRSGASAGATAYQKPSGGIPSTDMTSGVQTSLGKADTAYQKPGTGIPKSDMASDVQTSLGKADTALQSHQSLANYYATTDTAETILDDADFVPFYDNSATAKRKSTWANIKAKLKAYFDTLYSTVKTSVTKAESGTTLSLVTTGEKWNYDYQNIKRKRVVVTSGIGTSGIGTWTDSATPSSSEEADWIYISDLTDANVNTNSFDVSLKFDPASGEPITLGGYIIDTTSHKMCIKFGNEIATPANAKVAIDLSWNRNEVSTI